MNGLMMSEFHRERFTDPTCRMKGSEAHSPQAADVVETALTNKNLDFKSVNCSSITYNSSHSIPEDTSSKEDQQRSTEGRSDSALERPVEEKSSDYSGENNSSFDKSFEGDYYSNKYTTENSNSSDLESDIDRDELIPNSPKSEVNHRQPLDYYQRLPSNLPFGSGFSPEEARLRLQLKEVGPLNPGAFAESEYRRRLAFSNGKAGGLIPNSSSQPNSPESKTPGSAILYPRRLPRSADELDETLKPNIREGLYFCHLCSFSGTTQAAFDQHMTVHFEHVCPHCDYKSRTEGRLKRHIKDFHTEDPDGGYGARTMPGRPKVFRCKQCEFSTTDKIEFWSHSRTHIKEDKLLQCPRCPFVTEYKHHLEYHLRNHFGSKPFKCPKCNYACVNKSMLNSHMKSHTNVYQYRCADCTYATKYCHSLKLHLRKYNHKPAAVLNSDGSLPQGVDATASGLSLLSKRGPPRGPRGPRKDKLDQGISGIPPFAMPPSPMGPLPGLPSMISPFWPMIPGRLPNGLPAPLGLGHRFASPLAGLPGLPGIKKEEMTQSVLASSTDINPYKCNFCSFVGTSREVLTSHVMKVHATDNQDLFSMFGIPSESLLNEKRLNPMSSLTSPLKSPRMNFYPPNLSPSQGIKREHPDSVSRNSHDKEGQNNSILSPYSFMNGKYSSHEAGKDESIDILKQMTLKFGSGPVETPKKPKLSTQLGDAPLDLTKPRFSPPITLGQQSPLHQDSKPEDGNQSSGENSVYSNEMTSPTPRKRSRKGKAFKLDTLCMKLQEQQRNAMESDEDSVEMEEYPAELLPVDNEYKYEREEEAEEEKNFKEGHAGLKGETTGDAGEEDENSAANGQIKEGKEMGEDDFRQIHSSLEMLNETRTDNVSMIRTTDEHYDVASGMGNKPVEFNIVKQDSSEYKNKNTDNGGSYEPSMNGGQNRRKHIPAAVQRGVDIAWKMFNDPKLVSNFIKTEVEDDVKSAITDEHKTSKHDEEISHTQKKDEYECPHCKISFGDCIMYTMHMGYHGYKDPYQCNMCGNTCKDRVEFNLHIARVAHS